MKNSIKINSRCEVRFEEMDFGRLVYALYYRVLYKIPFLNIVSSQWVKSSVLLKSEFDMYPPGTEKPYKDVYIELRNKRTYYINSQQPSWQKPRKLL